MIFFYSIGGGVREVRNERKERKRGEVSGKQEKINFEELCLHLEKREIEKEGHKEKRVAGVRRGRKLK